VSVKINSLKIADQVLIRVLYIFRVKCVSMLCPLPKLSSSISFLKLSVFKYILGDIFQDCASVPDLVEMHSNAPVTLSDEVSNIFI
jgi:hypothetical protein